MGVCLRKNRGIGLPESFSSRIWFLFLLAVGFYYAWKRRYFLLCTSDRHLFPISIYWMILVKSKLCTRARSMHWAVCSQGDVFSAQLCTSFALLQPQASLSAGGSALSQIKSDYRDYSHLCKHLFHQCRRVSDSGRWK